MFQYEKKYINNNVELFFFVAKLFFIAYTRLWYNVVFPIQPDSNTKA